VARTKTLAFAFLTGMFFLLGQGAALAQSDEALASSFQDQQVSISHIAGDVKILRTGTSEWASAEENAVLQVGDQIKTGIGASLDIVYDESVLNVVHVGENTLLEFTSIEPTYIHLMDGSIFNSLEALPEDQPYQVSTETAVSAIRGTQFLRTYRAAEGSDSTVVSEGSVDSFPLLPNGTVSAEPILIEKDNSLTITPEMIRTKPILDIRPSPMSEGDRQRMGNFAQGVQTRLERFAGGPASLREKREQARTAMNRPEFRERLYGAPPGGGPPFGGRPPFQGPGGGPEGGGPGGMQRQMGPGRPGGPAGPPGMGPGPGGGPPSGGPQSPRGGGPAPGGGPSRRR